MNIKFSHNWNNKLNCDCFTTIRRWTESKHKYYFESKGKAFNVLLNNIKYGEAVLHDVKVQNINSVDPLILSLDVGNFNHNENLELFKKFGLKSNDTAIILIFRKKKI